MDHPVYVLVTTRLFRNMSVTQFQVLYKTKYRYVVGKRKIGKNLHADIFW